MRRFSERVCRQSSRSSRSSGASRASTLVEIVIVLALVAIIATITIPRFGNSLDRYRAELAARRVVNDLAYARSDARAASTTRSVTFDIVGNGYTLVGVADPTHLTVPYVVVLTAAPYEATIISATFDDGANLGDSVTDVVFDGFGRPDSGGTVQVQVGGASRTVILDGDTGEARVR